MEATINQEYVLHEKRVKELSRQAFARAHKNATVVDLEEQLPESAEIGTLYIVRKPVNYVGSDALFEFEESGWRFIRCGDLPEDCTYKGEVACMGDLPDNPSVGDFYSVKNLDGKVKTVYFAHGWKALGREV